MYIDDSARWRAYLIAMIPLRKGDVTKPRTPSGITLQRERARGVEQEGGDGSEHKRACGCVRQRTRD